MPGPLSPRTGSGGSDNHTSPVWAEHADTSVRPRRAFHGSAALALVVPQPEPQSGRRRLDPVPSGSMIVIVSLGIPDRDTFTGRRHHASLTLARPIRRRVLRRQGTYSDNRPISPALTHQKVRRRKGADAAARAVTAGRSRYVGPAAGGDHLHRRCSRHSDPSLLAARRYPLHHCRSRVSGDQSSMMTDCAHAAVAAFPPDSAVTGEP